MREDLEKPNLLRIFKHNKNVNTIKNQKINMENLTNTIATTFLTILGTGTFGAICFTFYTVVITF
jgi:hypothetical protein